MPSTGPFAPCLICASADTRAVAANQSFGINIFQCTACGFVQSEYVSERALESYYTHVYRSGLGEQALDSVRRHGTAQAEGQIAFLRECASGLRVQAALDYGAADGSMGRAMTAIADKVWVTELDPQFATLLRADSQLTFVERERLASGEFAGAFDLIVISHVLEHLTDPYEILDLFASILKPGGLLLVDIPNEVRLLERGFQAKGHLSYFSTHSFARFVETQGSFDLMELRTCNREVDDFIASGFSSPEEFGIAKAKDGTVIRSLLRNRPVAARRPARRHAFDQSALLNEYSARLLHYFHMVVGAQARIAELEGQKAG
jgi:2-polyprenyl-3-methyl-5-hydroxy-6-metoxy-1,4-benzoquinol methylase